MTGEPELLAMLDELIQEVAGITTGPDDGFFEAGLDSAQVVRLHGRLQARLGRELPVTALFRYPSRRAFARHLAAPPSGPAPASTAAAIPAQPPAPTGAPRPLAPQQRRDLRARLRGQG